MPTTDFQNPSCPAYDSHSMNAAERLFPGVELLSTDQDEQVTVAADAEYRACEGH